MNFMRRIGKSPVYALILINVSVFLLIRLILLCGGINLTEILALAGGFRYILDQPWGLLTYMFVQADILNLIFNMLWLWAFGIIISRFESDRLLVASYLISGVAGGLCFEAACSGASLLVGASASVLGIIGASAVLRPRLQLNLILFGNVELRWVALVAVIICGIAPGLDNIPTLASHLGGLAGGFLTGLLSRKINFVSLRTNKSSKRAFNTNRARMHERHGLTDDNREELDRLLEKVGRSGYKSLSASERRKLFSLSERIKKP